MFKQFISAAVAELADASDSKSDAGDSVWVRVPPAAWKNPNLVKDSDFFMLVFRPCHWLYFHLQNDAL